MIILLLDTTIRQKLINQVLAQISEKPDLDDEAIRRLILLIVAREFSGSRLSFQDRQEIAVGLFHAMRGLDILQPMLDDPQITEIMVNGPVKIFYEKGGKVYPADLSFENTRHLSGVITNFFGRANRLINEKSPIADMRLPGGARVHAALPPIAPDGPVLTIRKFCGLKPDMPSLIKYGFITEAAANYLIEAVRARRSIFICGGTGTGKTTFLNVLSESIPPQERIVTIEDAAELMLQDIPNLVRLEARQVGPDGTGAVILSDLIRAALRMRPDRIIVGEVRGQEAFDMLQAMNTGHPGSLCTGHGNSCQDMLDRLSLMILMAVQLPWDAIRGLISAALDIIVHLCRTADGQRQVSDICLIRNKGQAQYSLQSIYQRSRKGDLCYVLEETNEWLYTDV